MKYKDHDYEDYAPGEDTHKSDTSVTPTGEAIAKLMASSPVVGFLFGFGLAFGMSFSQYLMHLMK